MLYRHNIENCLEAKVGAGGIAEAELTGVLAELAPRAEALKEGKNEKATALLKLARRTDDLPSIRQVTEEITGSFSHVIVVGAGGSGLSGRALAAFKPAASNPSLSFLENIDPDAIDAVLEGRDMAKTAFIVISKSGATAETVAHFYAIYGHVKRHIGEAAGKHFTLITGAQESPLRQAGLDFGCRILEHESDIGGRFAILTNVGLLPGALLGLDIAQLRAGAGEVAQHFLSVHPQNSPPAIGAALHVAFMRKQILNSVFFAYAQRLSGLGSWWRQCWAESLGKNGKGSTPLRAIGTTDQHSQLQLYLDGPRDKLFHLLTVKRKGTGQAMDIPATKELAYLHGKTTGDVMAAEQKATLETLVHNQCPVRVFELDQLDERAFGALLMHFTLEIALTAELLGINAFDQPAVEHSKRLAREYLLSGNA